MNWYYDLGGQRQGPVPEAELDRLLAAGTLNANTLVWCEGMANWAPLREARPASDAAPATTSAAVPEGWVRCTATGRYFPPSQIVYLDGKAYSAEAKAGIVQGVMQGGELPDDDESLRTGPAWEQRAQLGFFKAIWETIKAVLVDPSRAFETMKRTGGIGTPLGFYVLVGSAGTILALIYNFVFQGTIQSFMPQQPGSEMVPIAQATMTVIIAVLTPLIMIISSFITAGFLHLALMICSGAKQPFETTYRTHCYAMGAGTVLAVIPICGGTIGFIWGLVCMCIGLAKTHRIETGRAVGAMFVALIGGCVLCCTLYMLGAGAVFAALAGSGALKQ